jgi:hypothetical protein
MTADLTRDAVVVVAAAVGCALAAYLALAAGRSVWRQPRFATLVVLWATLGAGAVSVNLYLNARPLAPSTYEEVELVPVRPHVFAMQRHVQKASPFLVHVQWTLPIVGALGGLLAAMAMPAAGARLRWSVFALLSAAVWSVGFLVGGRVSVIGFYYGGHAVSDIFERLGLAALPGIAAGAFMGAFVGGWIAGGIAHWGTIRLRSLVQPQSGE